MTVPRPRAEVPADPAGPRSPLRVMGIVEALAGEPRGLSLTQLSERLAIPKTSVLNHLRVLADADYLVLADTRYRLGPAALRLGLLVAAAATVPAAAAPLLESLVEATGETAMLAMLDRGAMQAVYVARCEGGHAIRFSPAIGARRPLYCTAFGRALLAGQDDAFVDRYFAAGALRRVTEHTVTAERSLRRVLQAIRDDGLAFTSEEHTRDAGALAAPVFERGKPVDYAIGVALPISRAGPPALARLRRAVGDAATRLTRTMGG